MSVPPPEATLSGEGSLIQSFQELQTALAGESGIAYMPVGGGQVRMLGTLTTGPAWSTIKAPLSIAAIRESGSEVLPVATSAIETSNNEAAQSMWDGLGGAEYAAEAVQAVLSEAGDASTVVQRTRTRPEFTAFGQTEWSLKQQAQFSSEMQCIPYGASVVDLMRNVIGSQQWGLGVFPGAAIKGGWGPDTSGGYLVRQIGIIDIPGGQTAVAMAVRPTSGSFEDGTSMLDTMGNWLQQHTADLPFGSC